MLSLGAFAATSHETAIFYIVAVACFGLAAFAGPVVGRFAGGAVGLVGLGLGFFVFPTMWQTVDAAF